MTRKGKIAAMVAATVMCASGFTWLSACGDDNTLKTGWDAYKGEELAQNEVRVNVQETKAYVRWNAVDGAEGYNVYTSPTRYGTYTKINDTVIKGTRYLAESNAFGYFKVTAIKNGADVDAGEPISVWSANTLVVGENDDMAKVQADIDEIHDTDLEHGQFSATRFATMFMPGEYPDIDMKLGYYSAAYGLGGLPTDTVVGSVYVSPFVLSGGNATCTFWRSIENFATGDTRFAVSQATSIRRMQFDGDLKLAADSSDADAPLNDKGNPEFSSPWSSGGFLANSKVTGTVYPRTQQQWMSRNDEWGKWDHASNHNFVFAGCVGNTPADYWNNNASNGRSTVLEKTEKMAEKPFLTYDGRAYSVFVPDVEENTGGITWADDKEEAGSNVAMKDFYIANEKTDDDKTLNAALAAGKNILLTPGHYKLEKALRITKANTVFMGLGYATLEISDNNTDAAIKIADVDGVRVADILVDAGNYSENMIVVGDQKTNVSHAQNPTVLSNIYLRIGGIENKHTETKDAMVINSNDVLGDNFWIWRADHSSGVAWEDYVGTDRNGNEVTYYGNPVDKGLLVNGDRVFCYALMVEHTEGHQTYWAGEDGMTVMYQCETPYNITSQEQWMSHDGTVNGYAAYKVDDDVQNHRAYGIGIYLVNRTGNVLENAIEAPDNDGIYLYHMAICSFAAEQGAKINHIVNGLGNAVGQGFSSQRQIWEKFGKGGNN